MLKSLLLLHVASVLGLDVSRIAAPTAHRDVSAVTTLPTRRALLGAAAAAAASRALPASAAGTLVTLELNVARAPSAPLRIEILPENAPKSAEYFLALCRGTLLSLIHI